MFVVLAWSRRWGRRQLASPLLHCDPPLIPSPGRFWPFATLGFSPQNIQHPFRSSPELLRARSQPLALCTHALFVLNPVCEKQRLLGWPLQNPSAARLCLIWPNPPPLGARPSLSGSASLKTARNCPRPPVQPSRFPSLVPRPLCALGAPSRLRTAGRLLCALSGAIGLRPFDFG